MWRVGTEVRKAVTVNLSIRDLSLGGLSRKETGRTNNHTFTSGSHHQEFELALLSVDPSTTFCLTAGSG